MGCGAVGRDASKYEGGGSVSAPINDGGPAFPCTTGSDGGIFQGGMSLRDWFAGQALAGWLASPVKAPDGVSSDMLTQALYKIADDMLKAREGAQ